ncbi:MAG: ATP-dependent Clp protease ATP-binding subunit [Oscillospiraceae bacterium]|jgi:ATP-dependent Clp protease ATP-binding subunit ClpA|nr:ATP-dependent Clp protease ATP-binding subunit [Oscillospiraceae bacterium]
MPLPICERCKKNIASVIVQQVERGEATQHSYCLKCASELGLKPVQDVMDMMGMSGDDFDAMNDGIRELMESGTFDGMDMNEMPELDGISGDDDDDLMFPFGKLLQNVSSGSREKAPKNDKEPKAPVRKFLTQFCTSLTERAKEGKLDKIVGRTAETDRVVQILNRRTKNNPCLIGEPGVGKTAIAEGLAQRINDSEVPVKLRNREVWLLDLTAVVAGTQFRGQFENRMKGLIEEVSKAGNIILVIDEVHTLVGAGDSDGAMNAANILKPALSRGELQVIGATTFNEYRKYIEKDAALERRFQPVTVAEPSIDDAIEIIKGIAHYYEDFHGVRISDETARQAVLLSERYITDRYLPDKAIDLIDEASSDLNLHDKGIEDIASIRKELDDLSREREYLLSLNESDDTWRRLSEIQTDEMRLNAEFDRLARIGAPEVTAENLARVIELWTKIPASSVREDEYEKLSRLNERLKSHLIGQDEAIDSVCSAIRRSRVGISAKRKPVSFIFVGSTGVGKTELVKRLAEDLFNSPEALIRFDMSEFMEKHSSSQLVGSPPGYIGYDEAGQLTEKIRRRPYSVILFDEIEKAHPDVLNVLLQILDDGRLTDSHGRTVSFENTIIIMTTNAGSDKSGSAIGLNRTYTEQDKEKSLKALKDFLRPEFVNRVDEIIHFNKLSEPDFVKIAGIMMDELADNMAEKDYTLTYDLSLLEYLAKKSYSLTYGARNLRRLIQKEVEDGITSVVILNYANPVRAMRVVAEGDAVIVNSEVSENENP